MEHNINIYRAISMKLIFLKRKHIQLLANIRKISFQIDFDFLKFSKIQRFLKF